MYLQMVGAFEFFSPLAPLLVHRAAVANSAVGNNSSSAEVGAAGVVALAVPASRIKWLLEKVNSPVSPSAIPTASPSSSSSSSSPEAEASSNDLQPFPLQASSPPPPSVLSLCGPALASYLLRSAIDRLSPVVFSLDWSLEWQHVEAGKCLVKRGGAPDSVFMVISGRLGTRPVDDDNDDDSDEGIDNGDEEDSSSEDGYGVGVGFTSSSSTNGDNSGDSDSSNELSKSDTDDDVKTANRKKRQKVQQRKRRRQKRLESNRTAAATSGAAADESSSSNGAHGMQRLDTGPGFGRGSLIGEAEVLTERPFEATVYARRDSELVVRFRTSYIY